jgi:hypothetical protein
MVARADADQRLPRAPARGYPAVSKKYFDEERTVKCGVAAGALVCAPRRAAAQQLTHPPAR